MLRILLSVTLVLGAGLLACASYTDGSLLASRTAAQAIGWLCLASASFGFRSLRRAPLAEAITVAIAFLTGTSMLYVSYFEWSEDAPQPTLPSASPERAEPPAGDKLMPEVNPARVLLASASLPEPAAHPPCSDLAGLESLQCRRCAEERGLRWMVCQERSRLEYCEGRHGADPGCPSVIPGSPPQ